MEWVAGCPWNPQPNSSLSAKQWLTFTVAVTMPFSLQYPFNFNAKISVSSEKCRYQDLAGFRPRVEGYAPGSPARFRSWTTLIATPSPKPTTEHPMSQLTTTANFVCPVCKKEACATVEVPEVDWCVEPLSDSLSEDDGVMECDQCGEFFAINIQNSPAGCFIELVEHPNVEVDAEEAPFASDDSQENEWLNDFIPQSPYDVYNSNYHHLGEVLSECSGGESGVIKRSAAVIQRMIFAETISSMEAFLGDTLITAVLNNPKAMQRLTMRDKDLSEEKVSLNAILANPNVVSDKVRIHLKGLLYHNLQKVAAIFRIALEVNIFPDEDLKVRLLKLVQLRHDVVHRNGRDKNGEEHSFPAEWVTEAMEDVRTFVQNVQSSVSRVRLQLLYPHMEMGQPE